MSKQQRWWHHCPMRVVALSLMLLLASGCVKSSKEVMGDQWRSWAGVDTLMQADFPDATPIILVHGWNGSEETWPAPEQLQALEQQLHRDIYYFTYRTGIVAGPLPPLEVMEEHFERYLMGFKQVDIVAHSMGGLLVRQFLAHHPENNIRRVVFLSTPHFGTEAASLLVDLASVSPTGNLQAEELRPGSDYLWQLNALEGSELKGVAALNVFVAGRSFSESDLVVAPSSAWLPWAWNVSVVGNHHTLAEGFGEQPFIIAFLTDGALPATQAPMPAERDVWLRVQGPDGKPLQKPVPTMVRRSDSSSAGHSHGVEVCCEMQSALYETERHTLVISDIKAGERIQLVLRDGSPSYLLDVRAVLAGKRPVRLERLSLVPKATLPAIEGGGLPAGESAPAQPEAPAAE